MTRFRISSLLVAMTVGAVCIVGATRSYADDDWANLARYRPANAVLKPPAKGVSRIVFFGDSITDVWIERSPAFFNGKPFVDRGISGQTSPQMLIRFQQDVVALQPKAVVILAGINDILKNPDPALDTRIQDNIKSMVAISKSAGIKPVLCTLLPMVETKTKGRIQRFNAWLSAYAKANHIVLADYFAAMANRDGTLPAGLSLDGLHPNPLGYLVMQPIALKAIAEAGIHPH